MKKYIKLLIISFIVINLTGCFKIDTMDDIDIYTTVYPIEYITNRLYKDHSTIYSIYPNGIDISNYQLTQKQIKDYSKANLFIFNGLDEEKNYVTNFFENNKNIKIIDSAQSMEYTNDVEELWLDPSNYLMLAKNIKNGLEDYIDNHYLLEEINNNYEQLKIDLSNIDAKIKNLNAKADNKTIVVSSDLFLFLEKYGFEVISLEENDNLNEKTINRVKTMIKNNQINYIFLKQNEEVNNTINSIKDETNVELITIHSISNLTDAERDEKKDYITIMNDNIDLLKTELYN